MGESCQYPNQPIILTDILANTPFRVRDAGGGVARYTPIQSLSSQVRSLDRCHGMIISGWFDTVKLSVTASDDLRALGLINYFYSNCLGF